MNTKNLSRMSKKELKEMINKNGGFISGLINLEVNAPDELKGQVPEGAIYFEGLASNGDLNRNGYKIRPTAWKDAIAGYMENPQILLQHRDEPVGLCLDAFVDDQGLHVRGYIYDEYTNAKFSKGLYKALSTGHITLEVEFENKETAEVINEEEFRAIEGWDKYDQYVLCVTKLEWCEFSIVSIPSNRKSLITHKNAIMDYLKNEEEETIETPQPVTPDNPTPAPATKAEELKPKEEETTTDNTTPAADPANSSPGNPVATPESVKQTDEEKAKDPAQGGAGTTPATNALNTPSLTVDEMKDALQKLYFQVMDQEGIIQAQETELNSLRQKLNQPVKKSFVTIPGQFAENKKTTGLAELLRSKGLGK